MVHDNTTAHNRRQWDALVDAGVVCSRPALNMTKRQARELVDADGVLGEIQGRSVLCLANGGGQQSAAFALLGADVTAFDQSEKQLARDREAAAHYGHPVCTVQGDIRDLSALTDAAYDIVAHGYSLNYVPQVDTVFSGVARVLRPGGTYQVMCHNPFVHGSWIDGGWGSRWPKEDLWKGKGYPIRMPYQEGAPVATCDPHWNFFDADGNERRIPSPREFRHLLSTIINGLTGHGMTILRVREGPTGDPSAEPGTWEHYVSFAPPWLDIWSRKDR